MTEIYSRGLQCNIHTYWGVVNMAEMYSHGLQCNIHILGEGSGL